VATYGNWGYELNMQTPAELADDLLRSVAQEVVTRPLGRLVAAVVASYRPDRSAAEILSDALKVLERAAAERPKESPP